MYTIPIARLGQLNCHFKPPARINNSLTRAFLGSDHCWAAPSSTDTLKFNLAAASPLAADKRTLTEGRIISDLTCSTAALRAKRTGLPVTCCK